MRGLRRSMRRTVRKVRVMALKPRPQSHRQRRREQRRARSKEMREQKLRERDGQELRALCRVYQRLDNAWRRAGFTEETRQAAAAAKAAVVAFIQDRKQNGNQALFARIVREEKIPGITVQRRRG